MKGKKIVLGLFISAIIFSLPSLKLSAQEVEVDLSADAVSNYVWRGSKGAGASIQPSLSASISGFTLGAWGSTDFKNEGYKEVDFYASYEIAGFGIQLTDYWWDGDGAYRYFSYPHEGFDGHMIEGTLSYTMPESFPLTLSWNTFFMGKGNKKANGDNSFSTYIEASYPFSVSGIGLTLAAGFTPWESAVYGTDGFKFTNLMIGAAKEIKITDSYSLPIFTQIVANPATEDINFVFGITLK